MPVTSNVAWDERLEAFKGRDTTEFAALIAATAIACAACGLALQPKERLSLIVDITEGRDGDGIEYLTFETSICHRRCREPDLTLRTGAGAPGRRMNSRPAGHGSHQPISRVGQGVPFAGNPLQNSLAGERPVSANRHRARAALVTRTPGQFR